MKQTYYSKKYYVNYENGYTIDFYLCINSVTIEHYFLIDKTINTT